MKGYAKNQREMSDQTLNNFARDIKSHRMRYSWYLDFVEPYLRKEYKYLDLGCRNGEFLVTLREKIGAWRLYGVELHEDSAMVASDRGISVYTQDVHYLKFEDEYFDFVFLSHILEHTHDPRKVLWNVDRVTRPEGYVFIEVPLEPKPEKIPTKWAHWFTFQKPQSLLSLVDREIFDILKRQEDVKKGKWFRILLQKRGR